MNVILLREKSDEQGTRGRIYAGSFKCYSLELPWKENQRGKSCIPVGSYPCRIVRSPRFGNVYGVFDVPGRGHILIHAGNFAGDTERGLKSHVQGCILLGEKRGKMDGQEAVLISRTAVRKFMEALQSEPFVLEVKDVSNHIGNI